MKVTAEGIEDENTASLLYQKGCGQGQGYFFGRPVGIDDVTVACKSLQSLAA
jgi:EAL domain-containing protein (putative c-di-GMP-specific phosphodiesterase class I)